MPQPRGCVGVGHTAVFTHTAHRCAAPTCQLLLGLDDMGDFDPFAADYPPATCDSKKTRQILHDGRRPHVNVDRALSPEGVDRFLELVEGGHFTDMLLYRVYRLPRAVWRVRGVGAVGGQGAARRAESLHLPRRHASFAGAAAQTRGRATSSSRSPKGAELGGAAHEATLGHFEDVGYSRRSRATSRRAATPTSASCRRSWWRAATTRPRSIRSWIGF